MSASHCFSSFAGIRLRRPAVRLAQAIVAMSFAAGAVMKLRLPIPQLSAIWPWTGDLAQPIVRLLGIVDLAGALGVTVPALLGWRPAWTWSAACGCVALQVCAMLFHAWRGEFAALPVNVVLLGASIIIVGGYGERKGAGAHGRP